MKTIMTALTIIASLGISGLALTACSTDDDSGWGIIDIFGDDDDGSNIETVPQTLADTSWTRSYADVNDTSTTRKEKLEFTSTTYTRTDITTIPSVTWSASYTISGNEFTETFKVSAGVSTQYTGKFKIIGNILYIVFSDGKAAFEIAGASPKAQEGDPLEGTSWTHTDDGNGDVYTVSFANGCIKNTFRGEALPDVIYGLDGSSIVTLDVTKGEVYIREYTISGNTLTFEQQTMTITNGGNSVEYSFPSTWTEQ